MLIPRYRRISIVGAVIFTVVGGAVAWLLEKERRAVQAEAIRQISLKQGLFTLPPALREIARLRVENPDLSLQQLGEMLDPPVGKSGVNHRLRRLMEIAEQLRAEEEEGRKNG